MFEGITEGLGKALSSLGRTGKFTESNIRDAMKEVRQALLEADVAYDIAVDFVARVTQQAVGEAVLKSLRPDQQIIGIVHQELINLMGPVDHSLHLRGDLLAMFMTVCMAGVIVIYRMYPDTPGAGPSALQSLILIVPSLIFGAPFETAPPEIAILAGFGLLFAIASVTLAEGAKRVPAGQTALLSALETPLAPVLAFLILTEVPNQASFIGGAIVLVAVLASIREEAAG